MAEKYEIVMVNDALAIRQSMDDLVVYAQRTAVKISSSITKAAEVSLADEMNKIAKSTVALFDLIPKEIQNKIPGITSAIEKIDLASKIQKESKSIISSLGNISDGMNSYKDATKVASAAQGGLNFFKMADGISLAISAVVTLTTWLYELSKTENAQVKVIKDKNEAYKTSLEIAKEHNKETDNSIKSSLVQTELARNYMEKLGTTLDENGNVKNQEEAAYYAQRVNEILGTSITLVDGQLSGYQEVSNQLDVIINKKKAMAIMDAKEADYVEFQLEKNNMLTKILEEQNKLDLYKEIQTLSKSMNTKDTNKARDLAKENNIDYIQIDQLTSELETGLNLLKEHYNEIEKSSNTFLAAETAYITGDMEKLEEYLSTGFTVKKFDPESMESQTKALEEQMNYYQELMDSFNSGTEEEKEKNKDFGIDLEKALDEATKQYEAVKEAEQSRNEQDVEDKLVQGELEGEALKTGMLSKVDEMCELQRSETEQSTKDTMAAINTIVSTTPVAGVEIPVTYVFTNTPNDASSSSGWNEEEHENGPFLQSTVFDTGLLDEYVPLDSLQNVTDLAYEGSQVIGGINHSVSRNMLSLRVPVVYKQSSETPVTVHQSNNFYQPIERPSDITRKIEQVNKSLLKRR